MAPLKSAKAKKGQGKQESGEDASSVGSRSRQSNNRSQRDSSSGRVRTTKENASAPPRADAATNAIANASRRNRNHQPLLSGGSLRIAMAQSKSDGVGEGEEAHVFKDPLGFGIGIDKIPRKPRG